MKKCTQILLVAVLLATMLLPVTGLAGNNQNDPSVVEEATAQVASDRPDELVLQPLAEQSQGWAHYHYYRWIGIYNFTGVLKIEISEAGDELTATFLETGQVIDVSVVLDYATLEQLDGYWFGDAGKDRSMAGMVIEFAIYYNDVSVPSLKMVDDVVHIAEESAFATLKELYPELLTEIDTITAQASEWVTLHEYTNFIDELAELAVR